MLALLLQNKMNVPSLLLLLNIVYYSFIVLALLICAYLVYQRLVSFEYKKKNIKKFIIVSFMLTIPAAYISSRLGNIFYYPVKLWDFNFFLEKTFFTNVHTFHASIVLPIIIILILAARFHLNYKKTADTFFLYFPLAHAIGRTGCLLVGCCWGHNITLTISGENIMFTNPVPLYAILVNITLFLFLRRCFNKVYSSDKLSKFSGSIIALYLGLYGIIRIIFESFRTERIVAGGFTQAQIAMMVCIFISLIISILIYYKNFKI
ncbi:MAG: prolipoprotein diacylglyceryl transferase [bacterium]|nr:prolipoprotein diacylglyceryl transferase [bacterium]